MDRYENQSPIGYKIGLLLILSAGICWSFMGLGIRFMESANVWQILFYRSCALAVFLFIIISFRSKNRPMTAIRDAGITAVVGGTGLVFAFSGGIFAIQSTSVANAMFLFAAAPFIAAFLAWIFLNEVVERRTWVTMAFALLGISIMVSEGISAGRLAGNLAAIVSAIGFAVFTVALRWGNINDMMPTVLIAGIFSIITSSLVCAFKGYSLNLPSNDLIISLVLGFFQVGLGLSLYTLGSKSVPAVQATLLSMTEVILGPVWVWLFLNEIPLFYTILGGAILLLALASNAVLSWNNNQGSTLKI